MDDINQGQKSAKKLSGMARWFGPGFVYFFTDGKEVKIGFSRKPHERILAIQQERQKPLHLFYQTPGTLDDEKAMHERFKHLRIEGEWFVWHIEIVNYIDNLLAEEDERLTDELEEEEENLRRFFPKEYRKLFGKKRRPLTADQ